MWFALTFLLSASVISVHSWVNLPLGPVRADPHPNGGTYIHCDAWVPNERCCHTNFKKYDNRYVFDKYTKAISKRMYSQRVAKPTEVCDDGAGAWYAKCPKDPTEYVNCQKFHSANDINSLSMCKKSCGVCGTEAIMTTYRKFTEIEKVDPAECYEVSKKYPYKCLKYKMTEPEPLQSVIFANFKLDEHGLATCTDAPSNPIYYHAELIYRRRGPPTDMKLCEHTKCCICHQVETANNEFMHLDLDSSAPTCIGGSEINIEANLDADLNAWYYFAVTFAGENDNNACTRNRRVIISCENGVDFIDIDDFKVKRGKATDANGNELDAGAANAFFEKIP